MPSLFLPVQLRASIRSHVESLSAQQQSIQETCPHLKPNLVSALVGQGLDVFDKDAVYLCQYCQKTWSKIEVPPHLRPALHYPVGHPLTVAESLEAVEISDAIVPRELTSAERAEQWLEAQVQNLTCEQIAEIITVPKKETE